MVPCGSADRSRAAGGAKRGGGRPLARTMPAPARSGIPGRSPRRPPFRRALAVGGSCTKQHCRSPIRSEGARPAERRGRGPSPPPNVRSSLGQDSAGLPRPCHRALGAQNRGTETSKCTRCDAEEKSGAGGGGRAGASRPAPAPACWARQARAPAGRVYTGVQGAGKKRKRRAGASWKGGAAERRAGGWGQLEGAASEPPLSPPSCPRARAGSSRRRCCSRG